MEARTFPTHARESLPGAAITRRGWLRAVLAAGMSTACAVRPEQARAATLAVGQPAPPLVLHTLDGTAIATRDLLGDVVIVAFWATWCGPCRAELPLLSAYARAHKAQGLRVLGFSLDGPENLKAVRAMATTLSFPVGLLGSAYAGGYGRIWRLPVSFTIDREGRLAHNGWDDATPAWTEARLERVVTPLLADAGGT